ncbi:mechanosensitive channel protein [Bacteroidales bacterium]|nr:mechanosensitive channel protein [Bacteroidales bacterium]
MKMMKEFREFAMKGNVVDMAVGIIIGGAFGKIVSSIVSDIIMPPIGVLIGGVNFTDLKIIIKHADIDSLGNITSPAVAINYGTFIQTSLDFIIISFVIFMMVKGINSLRKSEIETQTPIPSEPTPSKEEVLLTEIRDLLKNNR